MKLRKHREDVKDLKLMQDAHVQAIAKRYQGLILMAEEGLNILSIHTTCRTAKEKRVLKDVEE